MKDHVDTGTDLIVLPEKSDIPAYFHKEGGIEELVSTIETAVRQVAHDYTTAKGRKAARSYAAKVSSSKTLLETVRKEITADWREKTARVNAIGKVAVERLDALRDEIKGPADAFEQKEADRVAAHMTALDQFDLEALSAHSTSAELTAKIDAIEAVEIGPAWEEFEGEAREAKAAALTKYRSDLAIAEQREASERELEELRREKAEREAKEEQERRQQEAARQAEEKAAREVQEAKDAATRAEREAAERAEAAAKAERDRIEEEQRKAAEEEAKRKADATHRAKIRDEIVEAFIALGPDGWETAVDAMIDGKIPHVKVSV